MNVINDTIQSMKPLHADAMSACKSRWANIAKPIYGMGKFEDIFMQIAGITGSADIQLNHRKLVIFCADNGVAEEEVSQAGPDTTAVMARQHAKGRSISAAFAEYTGTDLLVIDVGMKEDVPIRTCKSLHGTANFLKGPAMTREEAESLIMTGIQTAQECKEDGVQLLIAGELGMGNTSAATAVTSVLLGLSPDQITGRGAGLSFENWKQKKDVIAQALHLNAPDKKDPLGVLAKVGSADIAALTGLYIGAAAAQIPVVIDGFVSAAAALCASKFSYMVGSYLIPSHCAKEPGMKHILERFHMEPVLDAGMNIGEGTGALMLMPLLDMAQKVYMDADTFKDLNMEPYQIFGCH